MTSKILMNLLSETFIAGGPKINLTNEDREQMAQGVCREKKGK